MKEKVILIIRDGWGYSKNIEFNAIAKAKTLVDDKLRLEYPWTIINASGKSVGLPEKYQGNSEVGHLTIGSGRIVKQSLVKINESIKDGSFFKKKELIQLINNCKKNNSFLHVLGLLQQEGVHAHINHLFAILDLCKRNKFKDVLIHVITDGRDSPVNKGEFYLQKLVNKINQVEIGEIVTISGRYYAMDRDKRWQRTRKAYQAIIEGKSKNKFSDPLIRIKECYKKNETDEFIEPSIKKDYQGLKDNDSFLFYNLRTDRPRQLTQAIVEKNFKGWQRKMKKVFFVAMTDYYQSMNARYVFKEDKLKNILGEVLSKNNIKQLRISETEKYAHVTFFFNGQQEKPFKNEDRVMINSPKISTYDKKPEMSIKKIVNRVKKEIQKKQYQFIVINLVNADMVGHSGNFKATIKAVEEVDKAVGEIVTVGLKEKYNLLIVSDHGNAEDQKNKRKTSHTINPVPFISVCYNKKFRLKKNKGLQDIAPSVLKLMAIKKPKEMTGESILY